MNLTEKSVEKLKPGNEREQFMDDSTPGLGLRVEPHRKTFFWYRKANGYPQFRSLGEFPSVSVKHARELADEWNRKVANWKAANFAPDASPFAQPAKPKSVPNFSELFKAYVERHVRQTANRPERAEKWLNWMNKKYLSDAEHYVDWQDRPIDKIETDDVTSLREKILANVAEAKKDKDKKSNACQDGKVMANRIVQRIRAIFGWCGKKRDKKINYWPIAENPAKDLELFTDAEVEREEIIEPDEMIRVDAELKRLWATAERELKEGDTTSPDLHDIIVLAIYSGARKENILEAEWSDVKFDRSAWFLKKPKSGVPYEVSMTPHVRRILERRRDEIAETEKFVFPSSRSKTGHRVDIKRGWNAFRERVGIQRKRFHDTRRTHGAFMAMAGASLGTIGERLGHSRGSTATKVYIKFNQQAVTEWVLKGEETMRQMMKVAEKRVKLAQRKPKLLKPSV